MKVRINDFAREQGIKSKQVLNALEEMGVMRKSHSSSMTLDEAARVKTHLALSKSELHKTPSPAPLRESDSPAAKSAGKSRRQSNLRVSSIESGLIRPTDRLGKSKTAFVRLPATAATKKFRTAQLPKRAKKVGSQSGQLLGRTKRNHALLRELPHRKHFCPICKYEVESKSLKDHIKEHLFHQRAQIRSQSIHANGVSTPFANFRTESPTADEGPSPETMVRVPCKECGALVYPDAMKRHINNFHTRRSDALLSQLPVTRFPFVLLPPGAWDFRHVFDHYRKRFRSHPSGFLEQAFDWDRVDQIKSLKGMLRHFGLKVWFGYAVYEFPYSKRVVLECPVKGNATYVLSGCWKEMISLTKAELRTEYANSCTVVVHKGDWLYRVRQAL